MDPSAPSRPPARRADAARNRARILDAAREAFADPEADVSMIELARRAGVGSATLYRNFPSRREVLEALYSDEIDAVCAAAQASGQDDPGEALRAWLRRFYVYFTSKRPVAAELLEHTGSDAPIFGTGYARVVAAGRPLAAAAHAAGQLRGDLELEQLLSLVAAIAKIPGDEAHRAPILDAALQGLAPA